MGHQILFLFSTDSQKSFSQNIVVVLFLSREVNYLGPGAYKLPTQISKLKTETGGCTQLYDIDNIIFRFDILVNNKTQLKLITLVLVLYSNRIYSKKTTLHTYCFLI